MLPQTTPPPPTRDPWRSLWNSFLAGALLLLPLALSLAVLWWLFLRLTAWVPAAHQTPTNRLLALAALVVLVTFVGQVTRLVVGKRLHALGEALLGRIPLLGSVYLFFKEISHTMLGANKTVFDRVVLIEYPKDGVYALAFVTNEAEGEVQARTQARVVNVFVPTTPNPTSGFLLMVPADRVIPMEMTVAEGMKMVVSAGSIAPPWPPAAAAPAP
ncbi:MAG: DUF502 domain-containing protein [Planctomycetes bacterium]|nr:DUF502 domain-containing protein [Planctomycetota bacterium]